MRTRWRAALAIAGVALAVAGCSSTSQSSAPMQADSAEGAAGKPYAPAAPLDGKAAAPDQGGGKVVVPQPGATDRKLARSARLEMTAPKVVDAVAQAQGIVQGAGGYTGQESSGESTATLNLAVPADRLDGVLDQLARVGTVVRRDLNTQDVTEQVVDVDSRLATQRASVERIRALLAKATSVSEIASVESELTSREATLESLQQQQKSLAGSVAMATISMTISATGAAPAPKPDHSGFLGGLAAGWDAFLAFGGGLLTVVGAIAPFLIILGPLGWLGWRQLRRRRRAPEAPAPAPAEVG